MLATLIVAAAIIGIASAAQAISGFGFALLAVPLLTLMGYAPQRFRATIATIFTGCGIVSIGFFLDGGDLTGSSFGYAAAGVPAVAIGWLLGDRIFHRHRRTSLPLRRADRARHRVDRHAAPSAPPTPRDPAFLPVGTRT